MSEAVDVVVVGGGPAGLSAGLFLGRCRRRTVVLDHGRYRNEGALAVFGFFSRDGEAPAEIRRRAREQLSRYQQVEVRPLEAVRATPEGGTFNVKLVDGSHIHARKLVLAAGVQDELPQLPGLRGMWGRSAFLCPFCHAFEFSDRPLAVIGDAPNTALGLRHWTDDVILFSSNIERQHREKLHKHGVRVVTTPVARLLGENGCLQAVVLRDGSTVPRRAVFLPLRSPTRPPLAEQLGLLVAGEGLAHDQQRSSVSGVFICGDLGRSDLRFVVSAAADGAAAAVAAHREMLAEEGRTL